MYSKITTIELNISKSEFNPDVIMTSGQVFRLIKKGNKYHAYTGNRAICFEYKNKCWKFYTSQEDWRNYWVHYFDLTTNYSECNSKINKAQDEFLSLALKNGQGMRILKQDLWETIVTFIISQQNSISKITKSVNILCERFGTKMQYYTGTTKEDLNYYYTFPTAERIADLSLKTLSDGTMLGYRAKYILKLAKDIRNGSFNLEELKNLPYEKAMSKLQTVAGIGPKVGNCVCLYGLHLMESYPVDTWMKKVIEEDYSQYSQIEYLKYINTNYKGFQGYIQQLQFFYKRNL